MKRIIWITILVLAGLAVAIGGYVLFQHSRKPQDRLELRGPVHQVIQQDLLISITEGGNLEAVREVRILSEVSGRNQIISLVEQGKYVNEGDLLIELDSSSIIENRDREELSYQSAIAALEQSKENVEIRKSLNASNIKDAELRVRFADIDLLKYRDGEWPLDQKNAVAAITIAEAEVNRAQDRLSWTEELHKKGYATRSELEADRLNLTRRDLELTRARENLRMLETYTYPQRLARLTADLEKAEDELIRVRLRASSELSSQLADMKGKEVAKSHRKGRLEWYNEQIEKTKIRAPQSGLVVYPASGWRRSNQSGIEIGGTVHERQELLTLPDTRQMRVSVRVHESSMNLLQLGQLAYITIDAYPDQRLRGQVTRISVMPDAQNRWINPDLKVYTTEVLITDPLPPDLKPGMSARSEIIITKLSDALAVPIQAVSTVDGKQVCYVREANNIVARQVVVGLFNDVDIEIRAGLAVGDLILLNPPPSNEAQNLGINLVRSADVTEEEFKKAEEERLRLEARQKAEEAARNQSMSESLEALLSRIPADRREAMRERLKNMSEEERQQFIERMRSGRRGARRPSTEDE